MSTQRVPAVWILSVPYLTYGMVGGFVIVTLPQLLAPQGVIGGRIAVTVAVILSPMFWNIVFAPCLDIRFKRRTYAVIFGILASGATAFTVAHHASLAEVETVMTGSYLTVSLFGAAVGGWIGALMEKQHDSRLGAWCTIYNICGDGVGVLISGYATQHLSPTAAATLILGAFLAPLLVFPMIPAPPPDKVLAGESFRRFAREIIAIVQRRETLVALALFALPSASFALSNALAGWSDNFHATPSSVSLISGVGLILGAIAGCSLVPPLAAKVPLRPLYLSIGLLGAVFTLSLLLLPRESATYGIAYVGENFFQSAGFAAALAIVFETIGPGNPLAATTFALLTTALNLPIDYMELVDAQGYNWHGITGAFLADALVSGAACILLAIVLRRQLFPAPPAAEPA
ncbi:MAG TPA: hypothetical protein VMD06_09620 [Steroidobacteraceae bacterium]|nr:hypothetical protein [Steroidobacteraceae bacterium]